MENNLLVRLLKIIGISISIILIPFHVLFTCVCFQMIMLICILIIILLVSSILVTVLSPIIGLFSDWELRTILKWFLGGCISTIIFGVMFFSDWYESYGMENGLSVEDGLKKMNKKKEELMKLVLNPNREKN